MSDDDEGLRNIPEEWERIRSIRRFRELFHGRFSDRESETIVDHFDGDMHHSVSFALEASQAEIQNVLGNHGWHVVEYVRQRQVMQDVARRNEISAEIRQFSCEQCDHMWWRKVPTRKPVSRCNTCRNRFDPLPCDKEWGWAKFICPNCGNEFNQFGAMDVSLLRNMQGQMLHGTSKCLCFGAGCYPPTLVEPTEIMPPIRRPSRNVVHCSAYNCFRRYHPNPDEPIIPVCVHPASLRRVPVNVLVPAANHVSTGSTVKTFLTQDELAAPYIPYEPSLADIDGSD
ncbi:shiftless antiviral inhibitor of ribosomal frameshifting protein homolog [Dreissena polymorpha]|uniref:shiftless antiviral inhibitor of ribosomal frameshifting protein homolog n=1 Tax=Dreissena polymorpha TaxID=45954 RepID=UPI002264BE32|nr:shiftless antiviral inhibitor of ribosomal frameshifting protein homolog [Dreissena polymorpha]XP_052250863.1 shiftless antiviral inhibitor of ribosomal frameshifting protein homolog [Dreissena polymorpha]XP_052250864.1 shiftless antiviral inhibitor of ribosomal frameshifting protein homolog [Dreissena polymorpha]XP_052250865.1 shiftless antiviral inhibitor of ribosomal frameshifting protein homolog [Dreissena polymorpha]XP_052250867.1 shiftless antiviral inhibitor of ribosomal frameshifting